MRVTGNPSLWPAAIWAGGPSVEGSRFGPGDRSQDSRRDEDEVNPKPDISNMWSGDLEIQTEFVAENQPNEKREIIRKCHDIPMAQLRVPFTL